MAQQSSKSQSEELQSVQRNNFGPNSTVHQRNNFAAKKQKKNTNKRKRENKEPPIYSTCSQIWDSTRIWMLSERFESVDDLRNITDDVLYHLGMKTGYRYRILAWQRRDYLQREAKQNKEHNGTYCESTNEEEQNTNEPPKGGKADEWRYLEGLRVVDIKVLCQTRGNTKDLNVKKEQLVRL
eukprot:982884_1